MVGAAESAAQAFEVVASVRCNVEPPPLRMPVPLIGSQVLDGEDEPVPLTAERPWSLPVPVPVKVVTLTSLELQSRDIEPL